jgi:integrase
MATIVKRVGLDGAITHQVKIRLQGHPAQTATFDRLTDAKRWAQSTEAAIREGRYFPAAESQKHSFGDAVDRYLVEVLPNKRTNTQRGQRTQLLWWWWWWKARLGSYAVGAITPALIIEAREALKRAPDRYGRPRTGAIVNRYLAALSHLFTVACREWHWLERNPMAQVGKLKEARGRARYLSDTERDALLVACKPHAPLYIAVVLALATGARKAEIMGLSWSHVDLARGLIRLTETKNGEDRSVPLTSVALGLLREWGKVRRIDTDRVFPSVNGQIEWMDKNGKIQTTPFSAIEDRVRRARKRYPARKATM